MTALAHAAVDPGAGPVTPPPTETTKRSWTAYLLLLPGALWLGVFFILPLVQLAAVSLQSRYPGFPGYYYRDLNFENYVSALTDYAPHFARSFLSTPVSRRCWPSRWPTPWRTRWRSRSGGGST